MGVRTALAGAAVRMGAGLAAAAVITVVGAGVPAVGKGADDGSDPASLTPQQVAAQVRDAQALQNRLLSTGAVVAAATANLESLSQRSALFLERLREAQDTRAAALRAQRTATERARQLAGDLAGREAEIGRWARQAYMSGDGRLQDLAAFVAVLSNPDPTHAADTVGLLRYLSDERTLRFEHLSTAADATAAQSSLEGVVEQQRTALAELKAAEAAEQGGGLAALLRSSTVGIDAELLAALGGAQVRVAGTCRADDADYPNGMLPASALCALQTAAGKYLREAPARAFDAMSRSYQQETGRPLCVTDAYRSYAQQVAVYAAKPNLAARPGTSQHGLGLAVDMCGGVQSFGDPAHLWMKRRGPLYGWFHPSWAEPAGSKPEPWHWEFAG